MLKLSEKPSNTCFIPSLRLTVFYKNKCWYCLGLNGFGYYGMLIDGRSVYTAFKRKNNRLDMKQYSTLKQGI